MSVVYTFREKKKKKRVLNNADIANYDLEAYRGFVALSVLKHKDI